MDTAQRRVTLAGPELGKREWMVLEYLMLQAPKPAAKDKLLAALTGWNKEITPNAIEIYVSRLRAKLTGWVLPVKNRSGCCSVSTGCLAHRRQWIGPGHCA